MAASKGRRVACWAAGIVAVLVFAVIGTWLFAVHEMKQRVLETLGPLGTAEEIDVGLSSIRLSRVRLRGPEGWPTADSLRAERVVLDLDTRALFSNRVHLRNVSVDGFYLSVFRGADGSVNLLPNLKQSATAADANPRDDATQHAAEEKLIDHISLERGSMEFFDSSVQTPPFRVLVTDARATVDHLHLPALNEPTNLSMAGSIKGPSHTGAVAFGGWMTIATKDSQTRTTLRSVDLTTIDPYLLRKAGGKAAITGGTIDLTLDATVRHYVIHAPGTVTLNHLQISDTSNPLDTFLSIPTKAAIAALKNGHDQITLNFELDGNLRDPKFSLNESLTRKLAAGFAKALGVSTENVAKGAGDTVKGIGNALIDLLKK
jgi:Domain of Unknown Function (DUF748)